MENRDFQQMNFNAKTQNHTRCFGLISRLKKSCAFDINPKILNIFFSKTFNLVSQINPFFSLFF